MLIEKAKESDDKLKERYGSIIDWSLAICAGTLLWFSGYYDNLPFGPCKECHAVPHAIAFMIAIVCFALTKVILASLEQY
jgi:hypothetical protein